MVENALFHGIAPLGHGEISIRFQPEGGYLRITVSDNGVGCAASSVEELTRQKVQQKGRYNNIGLSNVSERLTLYFGENCALKLEARKQPGLGIYFCLPLE